MSKNIKSKRTCSSPGDIYLDGKYEILKVIHTSGMANIYLALDTNLNKQWCIKEIIKSEAGKNDVEYRSILNEVDILKGLNNAGIPRIVTIEEEGNKIIVVMDYIEGWSVKDWITKKGVIKQSVAVSWIKEVCKILIYLHNRKEPILYRDMKPGNIMVHDDGSIKLIDYGISVRLNSENKVIKDPLGTKGYAAPEQKKRGNPYDLRSDIYSLGKTLYHMLTGINPSVVEGNLKPLRSVDASLSPGLEYIINKCTQENPKDRYSNIEEVLYDLNNYDKLDDKYRNGLKRKIRVSVGLFIMSFILIIGSFIPYGMYRTQEFERYEMKLESAFQTGRADDYLEAISIKPLELAPYSALIDSFKTDGVFSKEEEKGLLNLINPNLAEIKKDNSYGELAYNIGKTYWYYYEGSDGDTVSSKWFKEAIDNDYNADDAKIYYDLSSFKKSILMAIAESDDAGMYKEYWGNLIKSKDIDSGEIIELHIYNSIADVIQSYSYRLYTDGVPKKDVEKEISNIKSYLKVSNPISAKSKELHKDLSKKVASLESVVDAAYSGRGGE